jgi:hypothetical protein
MATSVVDLLNYYGVCTVGKNLEHVGGDILTMLEINVDRLCFVDIFNVMQNKLRYRDGYNYKYMRM